MISEIQNSKASLTNNIRKLKINKWLIIGRAEQFKKKKEIYKKDDVQSRQQPLSSSGLIDLVPNELLECQRAGIENINIVEVNIICLLNSTDRWLVP